MTPIFKTTKQQQLNRFYVDIQNIEQWNPKLIV